MGLLRRGGRERAGGGLRRRSVSARILSLLLLQMVAALVVAGAFTFSIQLSTLSERVERELRQEVEELQELGNGNPEEGIEPYQQVDRLLLDFLSANVTGEYEAMIAIVGDDVAYQTQTARTLGLDDPATLDFIRQRVEPGRTVYTTHETATTQLQMVISSVRIEGSPTTGTLVVAIDLGTQRAEILTSMATYAGVSAGAVLFTGTASYLVMRRLLRPLAELRTATASIDSGDLTRRVSVSNPDNDVAQLAVNFNQMLDRLEAGFSDQRQFLDDAAHELRTPLTILRGNLEIMQSDDVEDVEQTRALVLDETDRMERLVTDLLLLAKRARPDFVTLCRVELAELAEEAFARVRMLGEREWRLEADVGAHEVVQADRHRLIQAVVQLAANAVRFSDPGDPVTLRVEHRPPDAAVRQRLGLDAGPEPSTPAGYAAVARTPALLVIEVEDGGIGIEADDLPRIFDRFGGSGDSGRRREGLGLGLTIVQAIAQAHDGTVMVRSTPGRGSIFTIWLPGRAMR